MIKKGIVCSLIYLFILSSLAQATFMLDRVVAIVNQDVITWSELYRSMEKEATPAVRALSAEERNKIFKENEALFLENIISFRLQVQEAVSNKLRVTEEEIKEAIDGIKKKYAMTDAQLQDSLKAEGFSMEEYKRRLADQILQSKAVNLQVRNKILITDADVEKFMKENKVLTGSTETYHIRQIFFKKPKDEAEKGRVEEKAQAVYAMAEQGTDFAELARQYSEDATRNAGGDLGFIEKRNLAKDFITALSSMKPGDVSKPFWGDSGMHILRLEEMAAPRSSADIKEEAKAALQDRLFNERYKAWTKSLREKAFIDIRL